MIGEFDPGVIQHLSFADSVKAGEHFAMANINSDATDGSGGGDDETTANDTLKSVDLSNVNFSGTTSLASAFKNCTAMTEVKLNNSTTQDCTNFSYMFSGCTALQQLDVSGLNTQSAKQMGAMFMNCSALTSLTFGGSFNTSACGNMNSMFYDCSSLNALDLSSFSTGDATKMSGMFHGCTALETLDISSFDLSKCEDNVFIYYLSALTEIRTPRVLNGYYNTMRLPCTMYDSENKVYDKIDSSCLSTDSKKVVLKKVENDTDWQESFKYTKISSGGNEYIVLSEYKGEAAADCTIPATAVSGNKICKTALEGSLTVNGIEKLSFANGVVVLPTEKTEGSTSVKTFGPICGSSLKEVDMSGLYLTGLSSLKGLFGGDTALEKVSFGNIPSSIKSLNSMFKGCSALTSFDLSTLNLSSVTDTGDIFKDCSALASVVLPTSLRGIGEGAFVGCADGLIVTIPNENTAVGAAAFNSVDSARKVTLCTPYGSVAYNITNEPDAASPTSNIYWKIYGDKVLVRFLNDNGNELKRTVVRKTYSADPPASSTFKPTVSTNWIFDHWEWYDKENDRIVAGSYAHTHVNENRDVYAVYAPRKYTVSFRNDDGSLIENLYVNDGSNIPSINTDGLVSAMEEFPEDYSFDHWRYSVEDFNANVDTVSGNMTCTAVYSRKIDLPATPETFTVNFYDKNGRFLNSEKVQAGSYVKTMPEEPGEDFGGWYDKDTKEPWSRTVPVYKDTNVYARENKAVSENSALQPEPDRADTVYMVKGQSMQLQSGYLWDDVDHRVASISGLKLTARKAGKTLVYTTQGNTKLQFDLIVVEPKTSVNSLSLAIGETYTLSMNGLLYGDTELDEHYPILWSVTDQNIAGVEGDTLYALAKGGCYVCANMNGRQYKIKLSVVNAKNPGKLADRSSVELSPLQSVNLSIKDFAPSKASWISNKELKDAYSQDKYGMPDKFLGWQNEVVRVTPAGKLVAVGAGKCTLRGTDKKKRVVTLYVTVREPVENVVYLNKGVKKNISYYGVKAGSASWNIVNVEVGTDPVASLVSNGRVYAARSGQARVICKYDPYGSGNGGFTFTTLLCVEEPALSTDNQLWQDDIRNRFNYSMKLEAGTEKRLVMENCYQSISYSSSKPAVAWVDEYGYVHAQKVGKTTIKTKINGKTYKIKLTVY